MPTRQPKLINHYNVMQNENQVKEIIRHCFGVDFFIQEEPEGSFKFEGESKKVFPDFLLRPKSYLVENYGFPNGLFIIEAKYLSSEAIPEISNLYIQCLTYKQTLFDEQYPFAVFHFSNLNYGFDPPTQSSRMHEVLLCTFGRLNIGWIRIKGLSFELLFHKGDVAFRKNQSQFKQFRRDLLTISFGSGNNKLIKKY
jgi:hypothetical protein